MRENLKRLWWQTVLATLTIAMLFGTDLMGPGSLPVAEAAVKEIATFRGKVLDGFSADSHITSIYNVDSITNGGGALGGYVLEASTANVPGTTPRSVSKTFTSEDWSDTPIVTAYFNSYGGAPGASQYYAKITAHSGTNTTDQVTIIAPNEWNLITLDLNAWAYKNQITKLEISFYTNGAPNWNGRFQVTNIKLYDNSYLQTIGDFEKFGVDGWTAGSHTASIARVRSIVNAPGRAYRGSFMLEATTDFVPGNTKRTVSNIFGTSRDLSETPIVTAYVNGYGGAPGATQYFADLTIWSGSDSTTYTKVIGYGSWNLLKINLTDWAHKNAVTRVDISFYTNSSTAWNGRFQIDDIEFKPDHFPVFTSSNSTYTDLINDMLYLHWNERVGPNPKAGNGQTDWREWNAMSTSWINTSENLWRSLDFNQTLRNTLLNIDMDDDGYVFMYDNSVYKSQLGWPFPEYDKSGGMADGWEFNEGSSNGFIGANVSNQTFENKAWHFDTTVNDPYVYKSGLNIDAYNSPYIHLRLKSNNVNTSGALYFTTATAPIFNESKKIEFTVFNDGEYHDYYLPVYKHNLWKGKITGIRLDPVDVGNAGGKVSLDFINCAYDTRHPVTNTSFINGSVKYFLWNMQDVSFLQANIERLRKAMNFLQTDLQGDVYGHIQTPWWGHNGTSGVDDGTPIYGYGIGSNYWDLNSFGGKDAYASIYYYTALKSMAVIERMIADHSEWGIPANSYGETATTFDAKATDAQISFNLVFWDPVKLRYVGTIDANNVKHDYGFTWLNLEAIHAGLADSTQASHIYSWLDGARTIAGDTSTGADIYGAWTFAPRATTKRNTDWYTFRWYGAKSLPWGAQIQDGGATLYPSFYDIMGRIEHKGIEDGWDRFKTILNWYGDAQSEGGYRQYYRSRNVGVQGCNTPGAVGVDCEFDEATIVPIAFLYGVMGIHPAGDSLRFAPRLPSDFTWYQVDRVNYEGHSFSAYANASISRIVPTIDSGTINITFSSLSPDTAYTVRKNGIDYFSANSNAAGELTFTTSGTGTHSYEITR